jgi:peptide/nickel transport system permease protein
MVTFVLRRLLYSIPVLLAASFLIFSFVLIAGNPEEKLLLNPRTPHGLIQKIQHEHKLDRNIPVQWGYWFKDAIRGDFGTTLLANRPITPEIKRVLPHTLELIVAADLFSILLAIGIGIYSAVRQYSPFDYAATTFSFIGFAMPVFWLALTLQLAFTTIYLRWGVRIFYVGGLNSTTPGHGLHFVLDRIQHLGLPILTLSALGIANYSRFLRASMLEVINADYIRTARAKGLIERRVVFKHAFRNALIPLMTLAAIDFGTLFGGTIITETVYGLPGMGRYFIDALAGGETYVIMAWLMVTATMVVVFNLVADLILGFLDPRIRLD